MLSASRIFSNRSCLCGGGAQPHHHTGSANGSSLPVNANFLRLLLPHLCDRLGQEVHQIRRH